MARKVLSSTSSQKVKTAVLAQVGGSHYESTSKGTCPHCCGEIQHWDWAADLPYLEGMATKYVARWRTKGGLEDLRKSINCLQKRLAIEELKATKAK